MLSASNSPKALPNLAPQISWQEADQNHSMLWRSQSAALPPKRVVLADDTMTADTAFRLASEGTALLWRGDFQNARQLLQAMARRIDKPTKQPKGGRRADKRAALQGLDQPTSANRQATASPSQAEAFHQYRQKQSQRARTLGMLLLAVEADYTMTLRRAPDVKQACHEAYGAHGQAFVMSLRELLGVIGAHEWRKTGVEIAALQARIYPHYGVFSPVRGEYLTLVEQAPLPQLHRGAKAALRAFDIGTGTGVIAAILAKRGIAHITATDQDPRALSCARDNLRRLELQDQVTVEAANLFPAAKAHLIVCNPPWIPARATTSLEQAVYDADSQMLRGFLNGLAAHLETGGEGWLILSDLAEHLGLRSRDELLIMIAQAGLHVIARQDIRPQHPKVNDTHNLLHQARAAEVTSLWRLGVN